MTFLCRIGFHSWKITEKKRIGIRFGDIVTPVNAVCEIRSLKGKMTQMQLAEKFNTDQTNISLILNHKSWRHI